MLRWPHTRLTELLGIRYPIVQAPMACISTAPLVSAVSESGALGSLGSALLRSSELAAHVAHVRESTARPFAMNFYVHEEPRRDRVALARMRERLEPYRRELDAGQLGAEDLSAEPRPFGAAMLEQVLALRPAVVSFHLGCPEGRVLSALSSAGILTLGTATSVREAKLLEARGMNLIVAQGVEAGGPRGTFASPYADGQVGTLALVPQIVDAVSVPVIAAGGIADGRGIAAALALGASGVQLGTAFLGCPEAQVETLYRRTLLGPRAAHTQLTSVLWGRPARAISNRFIQEMASEEGRVLDFPLQRSLTAVLAQAAMMRGDLEFSAMWAGQGAPLIRVLPAAELVAALVREAEQVFERWKR